MNPLDEERITELFCKRLQQLMIEKNISDSQLSRETDINRVSITNYKNGKLKTLPSSYTLYKLRCYFGVTFEYMLGLTEEKEITEESKLTGLSTYSIEKLAQHHEYIDSLDDYIKNPTFSKFLIDLRKFYTTFPDKNGKSDYYGEKISANMKLRLLAIELQNDIYEARASDIEMMSKIRMREQYAKYPKKK